MKEEQERKEERKKEQKERTIERKKHEMKEERKKNKREEKDRPKDRWKYRKGERKRKIMPKNKNKELRSWREISDIAQRRLGKYKVVGEKSKSGREKQEFRRRYLTERRGK